MFNIKILIKNQEVIKLRNNSKKSKKAQTVGQIFIYVLAIIVFSLTLLYGYKAVKYFSDQSVEISYLQFEKDIKGEIEKVEGDTMGTVKKKLLSVSGSYEDLCFVQSYPNFPSTIDLEKYPLIEDHIISGAEDKNMFLGPPGDSSFYVGKITVNDPGEGFDCIPIKGGKVLLRLESMGNHVKIAEWIE